MRVLVLGGGGQIGRAVVSAVPPPHRVLVKTHADLDIGDDRAVAGILAQNDIDWIVNAAAYTAVDRAEDQRTQALAINDTAVGVLAAAASRAGSRLLHLSTDFVFDGKSNRAYLPGDPTNPLSVYGASKLGGECQVLQSGSAGIVLRTSWVYAAAGQNFVLTMLRLMREREQVRGSVRSDRRADLGGERRRCDLGSHQRGGAGRGCIIGRTLEWRAGTTSPSPSKTKRSRAGC